MRKTNLFRHVTEAEPLLPFGKKRSSFPGSRKQSEAAIIDRCREITDEGGKIIDIGAQSTSPVSKLLTAAEEAERLMPASAKDRKSVV